MAGAAGGLSCGGGYNAVRIHHHDGHCVAADASVRVRADGKVEVAAAEAAAKPTGVRYLYEGWAKPDVWLFGADGTPAFAFTTVPEDLDQALEPTPQTLFFAGDSTLDDHGGDESKYASWGSSLRPFLKPGMRIVNYAKCGRSTKSFRDEGWWDKIHAEIRPGDFVLIEFGHNDQKLDKPKVAVPQPQFKENLWRMIREVRARHATPFLATPIVRLTYRDGHLVDSAHLDDWAQRMREVAHEANVTLVDMRKLTYKAADEAGEAEALTWNAKGDRTHPAAKGARLYADLFHRDVTSRKLEIGKIFVDPRPVCCKGKTPSFTMRIDDNHPVADWERVADIFERRGVRLSLAVVPSGLTEEQGACLKRLASRGHVIMDHTPNHTFYQATYHDLAAFGRAKGKPFVAEANESAHRLYFRCEADDAHPKNRRLQARIDGNAIVFPEGSRVPGMYGFVKVSGREGVFGLQKKDGAFELRDFWRRPLASPVASGEVEVLLYDQAALQPCDGVLRELAAVSRERFDHFGLPRPKVWVRPGGWDPGVSWERLARVYGREFGYLGADSVVNATRGERRWSTGCDDMRFFDWGEDVAPGQIVDRIEERLAQGGYYVLLSHMCHRKFPERREDWFAKCDRFAQLLVDRKIPTMTMEESLRARFGEEKTDE